MVLRLVGHTLLSCRAMWLPNCRVAGSLWGSSPGTEPLFLAEVPCTRRRPAPSGCQSWGNFRIGGLQGQEPCHRSAHARPRPVAGRVRLKTQKNGRLRACVRLNALSNDVVSDLETANSGVLRQVLRPRPTARQSQSHGRGRIQRLSTERLWTARFTVPADGCSSLARPGQVLRVLYAKTLGAKRTRKPGPVVAS